MGRARRILLVSDAERLGLEALQTLGLSGQRCWVLAPACQRSLLARSRWCRGFVELAGERFTSDDGAAVVQAAAAIGATHIVPTGMAAFLAVARVREGLAPARSFPSPSEATLATLDDKWAFFRLASGLGLPVPETVRLERAADAESHGLDHPVIVKPLDQGGGVGLQRCTDPSQLRAAVDSWPSFPQLLQRWVDGDDVHLTLLADRGDVVAWEMREPCPPPLGTRAFRFICDQQVLDVGYRLVAELGYTGIANLDFRRDEQSQPWLLECNPRLYATATLPARAGANLVALGLDLADGRRPRSTVVPREGVVYQRKAVPFVVRRPLTHRPVASPLARVIGWSMSDPLASFVVAARGNSRAAG